MCGWQALMRLCGCEAMVSFGCCRQGGGAVIVQKKKIKMVHMLAISLFLIGLELQLAMLVVWSVAWLFFLGGLVTWVQVGSVVFYFKVKCWQQRNGFHTCCDITDILVLLLWCYKIGWWWWWWWWMVLKYLFVLSCHVTQLLDCIFDSVGWLADWLTLRLPPCGLGCCYI